MVVVEMRRLIPLLASVACVLLGAPVAAQETSEPPPVAPSDYRLPPGDSEQPPVEGPVLGSQPVRAARPTPTPTPAQTPSPAPTQVADETRELSPDPVGSPNNTASRPTATPTRPSAAAPVAETGAPEDSESLGENAQQTEASPVDAEAAPPTPEITIPEPDAAANSESFDWSWFVLLAALALAAFGWLALRRRSSRSVEVVEEVRPHAVAPEAKPAVATADPTPVQRDPTPDEPKPTPDLPRPSLDPASLVSISPRRQKPAPAPAQAVPAVPPADGGLVTTNLAAKMRAEAEARRRTAEREAARQRPVVKGSITFDWS